MSADYRTSENLNGMMIAKKGTTADNQSFKRLAMVNTLPRLQVQFLLLLSLHVNSFGLGAFD